MATALTIAGIDPSGGAGVLADVRCFTDHGVAAMAVATALTEQSSRGVAAVHPVDTELLGRQLATLLAHDAVDAVKVGMLGRAEAARVVADALAARGLLVVLDPVVASSNGMPLVDGDAVAALRALVPLSALVTPNAPEASLLTGLPVEDAAGQRRAARALLHLGARAVLVKGGHLPGDAVDLFDDGRGEPLELLAPRLPGPAHGTGCVLSAAVAARLARGEELEAAVIGAKAYLTSRLRRARPRGTALYLE